MKSGNLMLIIGFMFGLSLAVGSAKAQQPEGLAKQFQSLTDGVKQDSDWQRWREFIVPSQTDLKWTQIPWLPTFREGIIKGAKEDKPVLLWTMNGHPLGCT